MDGGDHPWTPSRLSTSSRRYLSRSEIYLGGDAVTEMEDDRKQEFLCPFCAEEFDIVGLCCHVDEDHPIELKQGVCPVCAKRVGMDMVSHLTTQHGNILKVQCRRRHRRGGPSSIFSMLKKEMRDTNRQSLFGGHSHAFPSSNPDPDPFLSSLLFSSPIVEAPVGVEANDSDESKLADLSTNENIVIRAGQLQLSEKDQKEKARKCEFIRGLLLSTIFDDDI